MQMLDLGMYTLRTGVCDECRGAGEKIDETQVQELRWHESRFREEGS